MERRTICLLGMLVTLVPSAAWGQQVSSTTERISNDDLRFRLLEGLSDEEAKLVQLPEGATSSQLLLRKLNIGADDAPPLLLAFEKNTARVWADVARDGKLVKLDKSVQGDTKSLEEKDSILIPASINSQPVATAKEMWPTPRTIPIWLRHDRQLESWFVASVAVFESRAQLNSKSVAIRIEDRNNDGRFEGDEDLLKVDLNGDEKFDRLRESFPLGRFWRFEGKRYSLKWDLEKRAVDLQELNEFGSVALKLDGLDKFDELPSEFKVTLVSDNGIHVLIDKLGPQQVPTGSYQVQSAVVQWQGDLQWRMVFSKLNPKYGKSFSVQANQTTELSILGTCELTAQILKLESNEQSNHLKIQPTLKSETGLYLTRSSSGKLEPTIDGTLVATVQSLKQDSEEKKRVLASGTTQFACGQFCPIDLQWPSRENDRELGQLVLSFDTGPLGGPMLSTIELKKEVE